MRRIRGTGGLELRGKVWYLRHRKFGKPAGESLKTGDKREAERLARIRLSALDEELRLKQIDEQITAEQDARMTAWDCARQEIDALPEGDEKERRSIEITEQMLNMLQNASEKQKELLRAREEAVAEAERFAREREEAAREQARLDAANPTVEAFIKDYEMLCIAKDRSPSTVQAYRNIWQQFVKHAGIARIQDLNEDHAESFIALRRNTLTARTLNDNITKLSSLIEYAVNKGVYANPNPFKTMPKPRFSKKRVPRFLSSDQLARLFEAVSGDICTTLFIGLGAHAGLRKAEILNMRWEEIDFDQRLIHVKNKPEDPAKGILEFRTKNRSDRVVPLKETLRDMLLPHKKDAGYIITTRKGGEVDRHAYVPLLFQEACSRLGLQGCTPHVLRHTFASLAVQSGKVDLYQVKEWLGHSSVEMTQIYAHLLPYNKNINEF